MISQACLLIETKEFPVLERERNELVNEGIYGKALRTFLQARLPLAGIDVPFFCNEDWAGGCRRSATASEGFLQLFRSEGPSQSRVFRSDALHPGRQSMVLVEVPLDRPVTAGSGDRRRTRNDLHG